MILEKTRQVQFCPNAKCGTTTTFRTLQAKRCNQGCDRHAASAFWNDVNDREHIMNQTFFSFTHVRNPWDRIWSTYNGKIATGKIVIAPFSRRSPPTFVQFLQHVAGDPDGNRHWQPFTNRCLIAPNKQGRVFHYDYIFRLEEDYEESLSEILLQIGMSNTTVHNSIFNHTDHSVTARHDFYKAEAERGGMALEDLVDLVHDIYRDDIEALNYSFERYN